MLTADTDMICSVVLLAAVVMSFWLYEMFNITSN